MVLSSPSIGRSWPLRMMGLPLLRLGGALAGVFLCLPSPAAGPMATDPNGFYGFEWGIALAEVPDLKRVESGERIETYELAQGVPAFGEATPDSLRFVTIDGHYARATIRYHGSETHRRMLAYLEALYGPVERLPGSMMRGLNQQFNWRGPSTEVNLTYDGGQERGYVFIESRTLAPRFNDVLPEHAF